MAVHPRAARPASTTLPSTIPLAAIWLWLTNASSITAGLSMAPTTILLTRLSTRRCAISSGIELAWDRDPSYWKSWYGITVADINRLNSPIDFDDLLAEI